MTRTEEIAASYTNYLMPTYAPSIALVKGQGTKVWDAEGKVYLDFASGISVLNVGHCHAAVVEAVQEQAATLMHVSNLYYTENQGKLAQRLSELAYEGTGKCFFANSGAEANEGAIKLARLWGSEKGRYEVITMKQSFHGRTLGTIAATGQAKVQKGFEPLLDGFVYADFNDLESVKALYGDKTVAVMVEAVQGEGGIIPADPEFMTGLRAWCDEQDVLLICDEIQCGLGRAGHWFGFEAYGIKPDLFTLAKALGSGFPIGAIVASAKVGDTFQVGHHATTFGGTPTACAAALATLDVIEQEGLLARAQLKGAWLKEKLAELAEKYEHVTGVRGTGMMLALELDQAAGPVCAILADMGMLTIPTAVTLVRLLPPLNVKDAELEEAVDMLDEALELWHEQLQG